MEQELLQKVFEVVTNMQDEVRTLSNKIDNVEAKLSSRIDDVEVKLSGRIDDVEAKLSGRIDKLETTVDTLKDLPENIKRINKQLIEINSNIRYLWEDFKILEEKVQKI